MGGRPLSEGAGKVQQERVEDKFRRRRGLSRSRLEQLLDPDLLREPDEEGDKQQLHSRSKRHFL